MVDSVKALLTTAAFQMGDLGTLGCSDLLARKLISWKDKVKIRRVTFRKVNMKAKDCNNGKDYLALLSKIAKSYFVQKGVPKGDTPLYIRTVHIHTSCIHTYTTYIDTYIHVLFICLSRFKSWLASSVNFDLLLWSLFRLLCPIYLVSEIYIVYPCLFKDH